MIDYPKLWRRWESDFERPARVTAVRELGWGEARYQIKNSGAADMIEALYAGEVFILRGAFASDWMRETIAKVIAWRASRASEFHRMLDGCPDFHRTIDDETGRKYSIRQCKHAHYFYRWNGDPLALYPEVDRVWRPLKLLMGLDAHEYEANRPRDGVVDRIQVVRYPPGAGYLEPHADAHEHQRVFISGYMSRRGRDYTGGGFYLVKGDGSAMNIEDGIEVGDICIGYASVMHGVAPCDGLPDWSAQDGRWFLSIYSNASDHMPKRATAAPARLRIPGTLPVGVE